MNRSKIEAFLAKHERLLLWSLCALALLRVFFFNAVFPFFNNVDEQAHFDTVVKYSKGILPRNGSPGFERESAELIALYSSPEYLNAAENFDSGEIPPPRWRSEPKPDSSAITDLTQWVNHEASSPPIYYAVAGLWYNFGKLMGLKGGHLLYWIRFLNIPVYALLFWMTCLFFKNIYPEHPATQFSVLLLLAVFPQDAFYSITNDGLSTLLGAVSLYLLIQTYLYNPSPRFHLLTGFSLAATVLIKLSNFPILIVALLFMTHKTWNMLRAKNIQNPWATYSSLVAGSILPIALWFCWNLYALGDLTGSADKVESLGWTAKSFSKIWSHPFFHLKGIDYFFSELLKTFWRGELVWGMERIASIPLDLLYISSSLIFIACSVIDTLISKPTRQRVIFGMLTVTLFLWILFIAALSTLYNFGNCWYPSQAHPFFTSGRLMMGALLPFLILYVDGLRVLLLRISKNRTALLSAALLIGIVITFSELRLSYPVMKSHYNWFHLF